MHDPTPPRPAFGRKAQPPAPPPNPYAASRRKAWVDPHTGLRLYDPASRRARRARVVLVALLVALACAAAAITYSLIGFIWPLIMVSGTGLAAVAWALFAAFTVDWPQPPIVCDTCFTQGWPEDLADAQGRCPVCGGVRFTHRLRVSSLTSSGSGGDGLADFGDGDGGGDGGD